MQNEQYIYIFRIILAAICGGVIGIERQFRTKSAGTRTHIMIAIASCLLMIISKYGFYDVLGLDGVRWDVSRVAAGIVTSIGILGGGLFYIGRQGNVSGITTAAGLLVTLGVGMSIGAGMYIISIFTTAFVAILQLLFHKNLKIVQQANRVRIIFNISDKQNGIKEIDKKLEQHGVSVLDFKFEAKDNSYILSYHVTFPMNYTKEDITKILLSMDELITFEIS